MRRMYQVRNRVKVIKAYLFPDFIIIKTAARKMKDCQIGLLWISLFTTFLVVTVCEPNPEESNVCSRLIR